MDILLQELVRHQRGGREQSGESMERFLPRRFYVTTALRTTAQEHHSRDTFEIRQRCLAFRPVPECTLLLHSAAAVEATPPMRT